MNAAHAALERARDRLSDVWRRQHAHSHGLNGNDQAARARLRESTHPAVGVVWTALIRAGYAAMSVRSSVVGIEDVKEEIPPDAEESRRRWFLPRVRETLRPVTSHASQVSFLEVIGAARVAVEDLAYQDLDDTATIAALRAQLDTVLSVQLPANFWHVREALVVVRGKLDGDPMSVWAAVTEDAR